MLDALSVVPGPWRIEGDKWWQSFASGRRNRANSRVLHGGAKGPGAMNVRPETRRRYLQQLSLTAENDHERRHAAERWAWLHAGDGELREAIRILEEAASTWGSAPELSSRLEEYRRSLQPELASCASVDGLIDTPEVLVPEGAEWRYFKGESQPPPRWVEPGFDDSSWKTGPSGFGYGPDKEYGTVLDDMKGKYSTLYVRREFDIPDAARHAPLILSVVADDGFVAYLNSQEVGRTRSGVPGEQVPFDGVATSNAREPLSELVLCVDPALLRAGRNVLALQGLNRNRDRSTDFALIPTLRRGPSPKRSLERLAGLEATLQGANSRLLLTYVEGRIHQLGGKHARARHDSDRPLIGGSGHSKMV